MKCDELKRKYSDITGPYYGYNEVNEAVAELKDVIHELQVDLEGAKATAYADSVDAGMLERRLRRALWLARAMRGRDNSILLPSRYMRKVWDNVESKCRAMAEKFK
jgi:hypothetical protein